MRVPQTRPTLLLLGLLLLAAPAGQAFHPPHARLENFDRRAEGAAAVRRVADPILSNAVVRLRARVPDVRVEQDETFAGARWARSERGFLSGSNGTGRGIPPGVVGKHAVDDPARATKAFLDEHRALFGHGPEALTGARVQRDFLTPGTEMRTMVWEQEVGGLPVFEGRLIAHTTKRGELVSLSSRFHPDPERGSRAHGIDRAALLARPPISAAEAVARAATTVKEPLAARAVTALDAPAAADPRRGQRFRAGTLPGVARAALVWLPVNDVELRLCWEVSLKRHEGSELFRVLIDAQTGEAWVRHCLTKNLSDATYRVWTGDSPTPFSPGWPGPDTNQPPVAPRALITLGALNTNASPLGWINDGLNETLGNNVDAHLDSDFNDDTADLPRPHGSPSRVFDFPVDLAQAPGVSSNAAVVQLFYWCNFMHDRLYELGFTEAAGNFQTDNFGRGGAGDDAVQADAQDASGVNNANFSTPSDGSAPRMQMFLFNKPTPYRDGDYDAEVILHEYTHGLTERSVGGGSGLFTTQGGGLGEGWSDFYALSLLSEPADDVDATYPFGAYVGHLLGGNTNSYYFGIRRYPYSTDLAKNPLTFKDIDPTQASLHSGVPRNSFGGASSADEPHAQGEVWCSALWEARARLVRRLGWTNGNQLMLQLVTDGLALTPPGPTFLKARDAIIQADLIRSGGANYHDLWAAFARRGLGVGAVSPGSGTTVGVVESFDVPDDLVVLPSGGFIANGPVGGPFHPSSITYSLTSLSTNPFTWSAATTSAWLQVSPASGTLASGGTTSFTVSLSPAAAAALVGTYPGVVTLSNASSGFTQSRQFTLRVAQPDYYTELFSANDSDLAFQQLTFRPDGSMNFYAVCRQSITNFPTDPAGGTDTELGDDSYRLITLTGTNSIALYGRRTNVFFIGSNGYLTFDQGDAGNVESFATHFSLPRVCGLMEDLDPIAGGSLTWKELADRVAVTWDRVPEWNHVNQNSLQIEMFHDGTIRLSWLRLDLQRGLAGLSRGTGVPAVFVESDLTGYGQCAPPIVVSLNVTNGCALLQWPAASGVTYRVEFKSELGAGSWTPLGTTTATNSVGAVVDKLVGDAQRFYRVVMP